MDAWSVVLLIYRDQWLRFNLSLLAANIVLSLAAALFADRERFYLGEMGNWLTTRALPFFLCWGGVKLITLAAFGDYAKTADLLIAATSAFVTLTLLGKIVDSLRTLGIPIPSTLGSRPKPESRATP